MAPAGALDARQAARVSAGDPLILGSSFLTPLGGASFRAHPAPAIPMGVDVFPEVRTVSGEEQVTLQLTASQPITAWQVWIPGGLAIRSVEWDGQELPAPAGYASLPAGSWLPLIFYAPASDGTTLRLFMAPTGSFRVYTWAVASGLPDLAGETALPVDPSLMPVANMTILSRSVLIMGSG